MEENPTWEAWDSSGGWPAPRGGRGGPSLSSVLNELPSAATLRYRGPGVLPWGALDEEEDGGRSVQAFTEAAQKELQEPRSPRELPWPMQARRAHRQRHARDQVAYGSGSRAAQWAQLLQRSKEKTREGLLTLQPWGWTLKKIGGQFGAGTESYFSLLRFLLLLNVLASVLTACMVLLPTWLEGAPPGPPGSETSSPCGSYNPYQQGLVTFPTQLFNLLSGEGYLEWSPLFCGFYPSRPRLAVTYLCSVFASGLISLLLILRRSVSGLKETLLAESGTLTSYSHRVFSAWDFGLCGDFHVRLRQRILLYELQVELEEAAVRRQAAIRTLGQHVRVWLVRVLLNLLVVALLGTAFYGIYWATGYTVELQGTALVQQTPLLQLVVNYLPSIFISGVNFVLPPVFALIAPLEGYTRSRQIIFILLRTVFLRLASLVVLVFSLWNQITCGGDAEAEECKTCGYNYNEIPCWETRVGQEMYKLLLFDLLTSLAFMLLIQFPRKIPPSKPCGPFRGQPSIWAQIPESISSLPQTTQNFLFFLGTQAFAVPLLLFSSILMAYTVALANSYGRLISELKRQIEREAQNKVFLAQRAVALSSTNGAL
ncbi:transmembrane channel-like protein 4 isoform X2 [Lemur catta]|uniref:transmembrane channel-like protein 4 isoform X2 n=1 Tax=Lemur catta TaxID=9447 RepID=UPI001E26A2DA|nr:transmembrane channel-like protein 4 isoform X2 [Lemur catta]